MNASTGGNMPPMDGGRGVVSRWRARVGRPLVVAHRGASAVAPENSLGALRRAVELGADGVEFDVQRCGTGELVVFHDRTLARCTGALGALAETSLAQLRTLTLDVVDQRAGRPPGGEPIPTLEEWLAACPPGLFLNLEAKVDVLAGAELAAECARLLRDTGRADGAVLSSFHPAALVEALRGERGIARGALVEADAPWKSRLSLHAVAGPRSVHPEHSLVTPGRVRAWKRLGWDVVPWTVDVPDEARRCFEAGVDGIITNRPDLVRPVAEQFR